MQTVLTYLALLLTTWFLGAQNSVAVTITGFDSNNGNVKIGLYNSEDSFLKSPFKAATKPVVGEKVQITFTNIPEGVYAISVFHDEDADHIFDMYLGLLPAEDYGTSNNAFNPFGPPQWKNAVFEVGIGDVVQQEIRIR